MIGMIGMKRLALACAAVVLLGAAVFAIVRLSGRGAAQAERAAAQPAVQDSPAAEAPGPAGAPAPAGDGAARDREPAAPRDTPVAAPAEPHADDGTPLQLPPDIDVAPIVEAIERMTAGGPASQAQARELSLVLAKYNVPLPRVLSELVAAEAEKTMQPTAEEIGELREPGQVLANALRGRLVTLPLTAPDELEQFYVQLLATMARTSPSRFARIMAAGVLIEFASPPTDTKYEPRRWGGDPHVARAAVAAALEFTLDAGQGDLDKDMMQGLLQWLYAGLPSGYLMLSVLADPRRRSEPVDPLVAPFIASAEALAGSELAPASRRLLDKVLDDLRSHLGKPGSAYSAYVDRRRDIEGFYARMAAAITNEDKQALAAMMPSAMADKIASAGSLRDAFGGMPDTQEILITVVGPVLPAAESTWRATVQIRTIGPNAEPRAPRIIEHLLECDGERYRILDKR